MNLPGLITTATESQPLEITEVINNMILERIRNDNVLILAVSLANQDMDTSAALKIAGQADPQFHRTIGVLTGLDTVETGQESHVLNLLNGKVLKHGFIGLFNQAQKDGGDLNQNESGSCQRKGTTEQEAMVEASHEPNWNQIAATHSP
ncbi:Dynamin-B [Halotydeus destructor]|nr:Dynamin-B [Halotydeus destructor]